VRILAGLLALIAVVAAPPTSVELRAYYRIPDVERFAVRPDLTLDVEYGEDGYACAMRVEPSHDFYHSSFQGPAASMEELTDVMNEVVPPEGRGKELGPGPYFGLHCTGEIAPTEYESVIIGPYYGMCEKQPVVRGLDARLKRPTCESFQPKRIPKSP
jgi:hypothetical protein